MQPTFRDILAICVGEWEGGGRGRGRRQEIWNEGTGTNKERIVYLAVWGKKKKDKKHEVLIESVVLN